ncbi:MAG: uracil-DNA glycosylase [bacterium]|nr:uracil-DNA glycosylase [bacterium]
MKSKTDRLREIRDEVLELELSPLYEYRKANNYFPVLGEGSHDAMIIFIGEAPGKNEAETGKPFCGASGRILDELLASVDIKRSQVYVTNIVKDRPPNNRDPKPDEIALYSPFLIRQINVIQPKVIATLGRFSMVFIMEQFGLRDELGPISKMHGMIFAAKTDFGDVKILPLYHPAVSVYNPNTKKDLLADFQTLKNLV